MGIFTGVKSAVKKNAKGNSLGWKKMTPNGDADVWGEKSTQNANDGYEMWEYIHIHLFSHYTIKR